MTTSSATWSRKSWAWLWVAQIQFFVGYGVALSAWRLPFDWRRNPISDLAAAECYVSPGDGHPVCSPGRLAMSGSFFLAGLLMALGALLAPKALGRTAKSLLIVGGIGFVIVGFTPHLSDSSWHMTGALLLMIFGNIGVLLAGLSAARIEPENPGSKPLRIAGAGAALCGLVALLATAIMIAAQILWVIPTGPDTQWALSWFGLIERIVVYPTLLGMIVLGLGGLLASPSEPSFEAAAPADSA